MSRTRPTTIDPPDRPPADVLRRIVGRRRERLAAIHAHPDAVALLDLPEAEGPPRTADDNPFLAALRARAVSRDRQRGRAVIAEVKLGSPRIGSLEGRVDPEAQARLYAEHGAVALSVVVEPDFFHGSYGLLSRCRRASGLPAIAKDFVVDPLQLRWAADAGADAVLLIAALHEPARLRHLARLARGLGLVPLIETHTEDEIDGLATGADDADAWELIGINNRNLDTFEVDIERSGRLAARLPDGALRVAESGIKTGGDVTALREAGFDAFLVGEALLLADDPAAKLRELVG
jgi:indole-3-glycerol phosphate synthase